MPDVPSGVPAPPWLESLRERMERLPFEPSQVVAGVLVVAVLAVAGLARLVSGARGPTASQVEAGLPRAETATTTSTALSAGAAAEDGDAGGEVVVHVAGAVARPGLYRLPGGARVADALEVAGGAASDADVDRVNLAAPVVDGERVYVPRRGEVTAEPMPAGGSAGAAGAGAPERPPPAPVDLNTATVEQLEALPGVGPSIARAIVEHRTRHGRFRSVDDLLDVRGIGESKLNALRPRVRT